MKHPSGIPEKIVNKTVARRGRLHAFETIEAPQTALVVIDMDVATVDQNEQCLNLIPSINQLANALRCRGGTVAWVLSKMEAMPEHFPAILGNELAEKYFRDGHTNGGGTKLWYELNQEENDVLAIKSGASAFFPGKCNLKHTPAV